MLFGTWSQAHAYNPSDCMETRLYSLKLQEFSLAAQDDRKQVTNLSLVLSPRACSYREEGERIQNAAPIGKKFPSWGKKISNFYAFLYKNLILPSKSSLKIQ